MPKIETQPALRLFLSFPGLAGSFADDLHSRMCRLGKASRVSLQVDYSPVVLRWGDHWEEQLAEAIRLCDAMLVLWTPESLKASWQLIEIGAAWILGKKLLVVLRNATMNDLPAPVVSRSQAIEWQRFETAFTQFLDELATNGAQDLE